MPSPCKPATRDSERRILVVDDDELFREAIAENLADAGFAVGTFASGEAFLEALAGGAAGDLVLLDWKMPGLTGIQVLHRLRERGVELPVIFLTHLNEQVYEERALGGGALDFVDKTRSFAIILRRIELILDRAPAPPRATAAGDAAAAGLALESGALKLDLGSCRAFWKEREIDLTLTEFHIVRRLVERAGRDVAYRDLYDLVHGADFVAGFGDEGYRANVRAFIKRIRQKFRSLDDDFESIENYPGFGYRWRADER